MIIVSILICSLPLFFIDNSLVLNNEILKNYLDTVSSVFTRFEDLAQLGKNYNLYYYIKFQLTWSLISLFFIFIISLFLISKIYLSSLSSNSSVKEIYFDAIINRNKSNSNFFNWFILVCISILMFKLMLFSDIIPFYSDSPVTITKLIATTKIGSFLYSLTISFSGMFIAYFIIELISLIRKWYINIK